MRTPMFLSRFVLVAGLGLGLASCGNRGPLYLPPPADGGAAAKEASKASPKEADPRARGAAGPTSSP